MRKWINTFRPVEIGSNSTIQSLRPGEKTANCITELQERVITDVESDFFDIDVYQNKATLNVRPGGKSYMVLQISPHGVPVWDYVRAV